MTKRKPNQPYFASWDEEVRHRKLWTVKGIYLTPKVQAHMSSILKFVVACDADGRNLTDVTVPCHQNSGQCLTDKRILKRLGPAKLKGGNHAFAFTALGVEVYNIWRARCALKPDHTTVLINGQERFFHYYTTKLT